MTDPRWTVITGASSGIGSEMARLAASRGRSLVLVARRGDRLAALQAELSTADVRVETIVTDLEIPSAAERLLAAIGERGIELDTLVNNAGFGLRGNFATLPYEEQIAMLELNISTLTRLCRLTLPGLISRGRGGIINLSSMAAYQAIPFMAVYAATKAYVQSFSEALHEEVRGSGVTVTSVCPGATATEFKIRADMEKSKLFRIHSMASADVARMGLDGYEAGRAVVVTGAGNHLVGIGSKILPRAVTRRIAGWLQG